MRVGEEGVGGRTGVDEYDAVGGLCGVCYDPCAASLAHVQPGVCLAPICVSLGGVGFREWSRSREASRTIIFVSTTGL